MKTKIILLILFLWGFNINAQSQSIQILDISVTPILYSGMNPPAPGDSTELLIQFKINNVQNASSTNILFGTAQNIGDILSLQPVFIQNTGDYYLELNGTYYPVNGYNANIKVKLSPQQFTDFNYITLFIVDNNSLLSNKLYFHK